MSAVALLKKNKRPSDAQIDARCCNIAAVAPPGTALRSTTPPRQWLKDAAIDHLTRSSVADKRRLASPPSPSAFAAASVLTAASGRRPSSSRRRGAETHEQPSAFVSIAPTAPPR
jgi:hypothetical protein